MTGISILIVDDDKLLVEKLEKTMSWEKLNISAVFTAYNIRQAKSLLKEYPVQILLCDIDMPQGSGLELLEWVRGRDMDVECVFLSSYANFAYAQMAVRFSAIEYLLKPISNVDLERALERIVGIVQKKKNTFEQQRVHPRMQMWENLLLRRAPEEFCIREAAEGGICTLQERFCLVLVRIFETTAKETERKDIAVFDFVMRNITSEFFRGGVQNRGADMETVLHISDLEWMLVLHLPDAGALVQEAKSPQAIQKLQEPQTSAEQPEPADMPVPGMCSMKMQLQELTYHLKKGIGRQMGVYLGSITPFAEISKSRERLEYMERNAVLDEDEILCEDNWTTSGGKCMATPWEIWEKELLDAGSVLAVRDKVLGYVEQQRQDGGWCKEQLAGFLRELVQTLYQYLGDRSYSFTKLFDEREFANYENAAKESIAGVKAFVQYIFEKLEGCMNAQSSQEDVIRQLKEYIEEHLGENLSRAVLAQKVFLSEGYVSRIFQKETGIFLPNYIAERRMEKAKEYLEYSGLPVSRIATEVGYNNFSYFSKTFRELVGCTPNEYRMAVNKNTHRQ